MTRVREYFTATGRKLSADEKSAVKAVKAKYAGLAINNVAVREEGPKRTTTVVFRSSNGRIHHFPQQGKPAKAA